MARVLHEIERQRVWLRLERRLTGFDGKPEPKSRSGGVWQSDYSAFPGGFPQHILVEAQMHPDEALLSGIKQGMKRLDEPALYFLAKESAQGDEEKGLEWEIPLGDLTRDTLASISPGFESYLYSVNDAWAIYFHHEGFAFCGGVPGFIDALKANCESLDPRMFPGSADAL